MSTQPDPHNEDEKDPPLKVPMRFTEALRGLLHVKGKPDETAESTDEPSTDRKGE